MHRCSNASEEHPSNTLVFREGAATEVVEVDSVEAVNALKAVKAVKAVEAEAASVDVINDLNVRGQSQMTVTIEHVM